MINQLADFNYNIDDKAHAGEIRFDVVINKIVVYDGRYWRDLEQQPIPMVSAMPEIGWDEYEKMQEMLKDWERDKYPERFL